MGRQLINTSGLNVIKYDSIAELFKSVRKERVRGRDNSSETSDFSFTGTKSFEEAYTLMTRGDKDSYDMVIKLKKITDALFKMKDVNKIKTNIAVEGYQPHIPNAIRNLPTAMIANKKSFVQRKVVDIFYNTSISAGASTDNLAYRGALLLSAIQSLEHKGYRVNLYVGKVSESGGFDRKYSGYVVRVKSASDSLNIYKLAFYIVNPSFHRRISFRVNEVEEDLIDITNCGYGSASHSDTMREDMKEHVLDNAIIFDSEVDVDIDNESKDNLDTIKKLLEGRL